MVVVVYMCIVMATTNLQSKTIQYQEVHGSIE